ncbi:conserved hypothetical protein [Theileria equi strain WA]|uniref:Signal peptide containing protein n=1 Tax=Theileria equi strain WA TaxID=1537102 RepID=L1LFB4_THEEQ|nr:conserved hypothetical protein [Theileria equi strain WA]EKX73940.1 conserved hypothetical protein [Theileria equi strain WA]|eukprot:XP_004833392.1 conserved hypothetical protein [Theileria equi strain WA]
MNVLGVLHLVLFVRYCVATLTDSRVEGENGGTKTTAKSTRELVVPITLDLAEVNTNSVDVPATTVQDGISTTYYYPKGKFYFEKIVDGGRTVWESTEKKCSPAYTISKGDVTFLALLLKEGENTDLIYYEKKNLGWKLVEKTKSENIIEELKRQPEQPAVKTIDLDLSDVDSTAFSVEESEEDKVPIKKYAVKTDHYLNEINYGDSELWKSDSPDKHCTLATVYFEEENPMLLSLTLNQGFVYLQNKDGRWVGVSKDGYDTALAKMKRLASLPKVRTVELDIADIDGNVFTVEEEALEGVPLKTVTPKDGVLITSVMDGEKEVWKGADKEHGLQVVVCYDGESPASVVVNFVKVDGKNVLKYHNKQGDKWEMVKKEDHEKLLEEFKASEDNKDKESSENLPSPGLVLDIGQPDSTNYQSFDYNKDGIPTRFIVPKDNAITSVKEGSLEVWKASGRNDTCAFVTLRLSDGKPAIAQLTKNTNGHPMVTLLKKDGKWNLVNDYTNELSKLRRTTESVENFTLDISATSSTDKCTIFDTKLYGVPVRFYVPKVGFHATKLSFGGTELWTNTSSKSNGKTASNKRIFLLIAGLSNGELNIIHVFTRGQSNGSELLYYGFKDGKWENISKDEYSKKFEELKK